MASSSQHVRVELSEDEVPGAALQPSKNVGLSVTQLKRWLRCRGLPVGGKKAMLIERSVQMSRSNTVEGIMPQEGYNYHLIESEDPLLQDPLIISKQEIGENEPSSLISTVIGSRETKAHVFILNEESDANQDYNSEGEEEIVSNGNTIVHYTGKVNSNENLNRYLRDRYRCNICDDVCADELEFKQHLEFHLELHNNNDINTIANTEMVMVDKNISLSETAASIADSSEPTQSSATFEQTLTNKSKVTDVVGETVIDNNPVNSNSTEVNEDIFNCNLSSSDTALAKIVPIATSSSSITLGGGNSTNEDAIEATAVDTSFTSQPCNSSEITEDTINSHLLSSVDSPEPPNFAESAEEVLNSKLLPNSVTATKTVSSAEHAKNKSASNKRETAEVVNTAPENYKLPKIPIRKCDCLLKKVSTECEFCTEPPIYVCGNCKKDFKTFGELKRHFKDAHKTAKYFCQECGRGYTQKQFWQNHTDRHKGLLSCYQCTSSFKTKQELEEHTVTHRSKCSECNKICSSIADLRIHMLQVHKGVTYTCKECNKTYDKYQKLRSHNILHHRPGEYTCKTCGKKFTKLGAYNRHTYKHKQEKTVICDECGKECSSVKAFKSHQKRMHTQADSKKVYSCDVCKKEYTSNLSKKICQNKHAGIALYKCDMCEKAYFYRLSLIVHKRIHTGEKPFLCFVCNRRFYARQILLKHCLSHDIPEKDLKKKLSTSYRPEK